jgi:hypothetical protein
MGACRGIPQVVPWVRLEIGFYSLFVLLEGRDISQVSWDGEVSPWPIITFWDLLQSILRFHELQDVTPFHFWALVSTFNLPTHAFL